MQPGRALTKRVHCVVISSWYRLAPAHPYPAANEAEATCYLTFN
ncbi:alpha/beta hydrolase fold domain-containing protein [Paraburkholderia jirisanensis]